MAAPSRCRYLLPLMRAVRLQYFLAFAAIGSLLPYISVYFLRNGLSKSQIGTVLAVASLAIILSPALATLLADLRIDARRVLAGCFLLSGMLLIGVWAAAGFWPILIFWGLYALASVPLLPLQDGINFAIQQQRLEQNRPAEPYHRVRVWGTVGFILPSLLLFFFLRYGASIGMIMASGMLFCFAGLINSFFLPDPQIRSRPHPADALSDADRLPTVAAFAALLRPPMFVFCAAMFLLHMSAAAYYGFYPIYLTEQVGIDEQWIGLIAQIGVVIEIFFMLSFGRLTRRLGFKGVMILGVSGIAARMVLLAAWPTALIAVGTQVFHGIQVLGMQVVPPVFLNRFAEEKFRHSMQGLYTILIVGIARLVGGQLSGIVAERNLLWAFWGAAALSALAGVLILFAFFEQTHPPRSVDHPPAA